MRVDHSLPAAMPVRADATAATSATAVAPADSSILVPYNAPGASQFEQILQAAGAASPASSSAGAMPATTLPATGLPGQAQTTTGVGQLPGGATMGGATMGGVASAGCCGGGCCCCGMNAAQSSGTAGVQAMGAAMATGSSAAAGIPTASLMLPFQGTVDMTQPFGPTSFVAEPAYDGYSHFHTGMDFGLPVDTSISAAGAGRVVAAGWDSTGYGNRVIIDHGNGVETLYGHLSSVAVTPGQVVQAGQQIGLSGSTGNSTGPHLHFGVQQNGQWVDPAPYLGLSSDGTPTAASGILAPLPSSATLASGGPPLTTGDPIPSPLSAGAIGGGAASALSSADGNTATTAGYLADTSSAAPPAGMAALMPLIQRVSTATGVSSSLIAAVVQAESGGDPQAVSPAGAKGLMQLMDPTAATYGVTDAFDPQQNLVGGTLYLRGLLQRYNGDEALALAAYNAGPGAVSQYGGVPPYPETQHYVQRVLGFQRQYSS